jgi:hypothetical protein
MSQKFQVRRGLKSELTANLLDVGEFGFCTDTKELFIGTSTGNKFLNDLNWSSISGKPTFATVATSGSYTDLTGRPTLSTVATSGSYTDLTNKPTIPSAYALPTASPTVLGGVKVGTGLSIDGTGILSATGGGGAGTVKSVNHISPDVNGDVTVPVPDVSTLATKADVQAVASGAPKGVYASVSALQTAFPTGDSNIYLVVGSDGTKEVENLVINSAPTAIASVTVTLNGVGKNVGVTTGLAHVANITITAPATTTGNATITLNSVGTAVAVTRGVKEVDTLTVTGTVGTSGNITITLEGTAYNVAVLSGDNAAAVVTKIAAVTYTGWTCVANTGNGTAVFTKSAEGTIASATTFSAGTTGTTATFAVTTVGSGDSIQAIAARVAAMTFTGWTQTVTGASNNVITFTATAIGTRAGTYSWSAGTTGSAGTSSSSVIGVGPDDVNGVATKIRNTAFTGWTTGGSGATITFTAVNPQTMGAPIFSGGTTGVTGTFAVSTPGVPVRTSDWYYWNGTSWIDGGQYQKVGAINDVATNTTQTWSSTKIQSQIGNLSLTNSVQNADFSNGMGSWGFPFQSSGATSFASGVATITGDGANAKTGLSQNLPFRGDSVIGHVIYFSIQAMVTDNLSSKLHFASSNAGTGDQPMADVTSPQANQWYTLSAQFTMDSSWLAGALPFIITAQYADAATQSGKVLNLRKPIVVDLTNAYGAGNEPDKSTFEPLFNKVGWFKDTLNAYQDDLNSKITKNKSVASILATNLVKNGSFTDGTSTSWTSVGANFSVVPGSNALTMTGSGAYQYIGAIQNLVVPWANDTDVLMLSAKMRTNDNTNLTDFKLRIYGSSPIVEANAFIYSPQANKDYIICAAAPVVGFTPGATVTVSMLADYSSTTTSNGKVITVSEVRIFNLTQIFGAGNEPDGEAMADQLRYVSWFEGTGNIFSPAATVADLSLLQLRPRGTASVKIDKVEQKPVYTSTANTSWSGWGNAGDLVSAQTGISSDNFGIDKTQTRIPHKFFGPIRTDSWISVLTGPNGRWFNGYGSHAFEAWNYRRTYRLSLTIALNGTVDMEDIGNIFTYSPTNLLVYPGGARFGRLQVGTDELDVNNSPLGTTFTNRTFTINGGPSNCFFGLQYLTSVATATTNGTTGQITWDANNIYVCVAPNTWKRAALATW